LEKAQLFGYVDCVIAVPAKILNKKIEPDMRYAGTIKRGAKLKSTNGTTYEILDDVSFEKVDIANSKVCTVATIDSTSKQPTSFYLKVTNVEVKAGETKTKTFAVTGYKAFLKLNLIDDDVIEIIEVKDSSGEYWYEVDYLAQDTIFTGKKNDNEDTSDVPYVLKLKSCPKRFISDYDYDKNRMSLIFGSGQSDSFDGDLIPNIRRFITSFLWQYKFYFLRFCNRSPKLLKNSHAWFSTC
jgi:hypothetical protein